MKKMLFIFNPHAGRGFIRPKIFGIIDDFTKEGYMVTAYPTQQPLDASRVVLDADGRYDIIVCSGGDGTLNEVISACRMHRVSRPVIGYIPAGTTNDFAGSLGIPKSTPKAVKVIKEGHVQTCDVGLMNSRTFTYVAAFGMFTEISYSTPQSLKNLMGHQAYVVEGMRNFYQSRSYEMKVTVDGRTYEGDFIYGMVSNSRSIGGFKGITGDDVVLNDGLMEIILVREPMTGNDMQQIITGLFTKDHLSGGNDMVIRLRSNHVVFQSAEPVSWTLDGENGDEHQYVEIDVVKEAISIITPSRSK